MDFTAHGGRAPPEPPARFAGTAHSGSDLAGGRLPVQLASFIGRERELTDLRRLLADTRLLTLTGAGGSGKTRLAHEVSARILADRVMAVAWIELAGLTDPDLLPQQVASTLGVREKGSPNATEALLAALRPRQLLLVLDNCEHLADACAGLADVLLRGCPLLRILATSREALAVAGERAWLVPPLSVPGAEVPANPEQLLQYEAVQLFLARARDVLPTFTLTAANTAAVAQVCRRLDGIPLAIELAAARVRVLTPSQIAQRLDNAFALLSSGSRTALPRHRTLRATIDWSYRLLTEPEQLLLQRLSVFAGSFTLEAVEAICTGGCIEEPDVLDVLARLVDRSLVGMREHRGTARYHLLETMRQYAAELFAPAAGGAGADQPRQATEFERRHAAYYAEMSEQASTHLHRPRQLEYLALLDLEHDNLRAALGRSLADADSGLALRLCLALREFWRMRGHFAEARRWMGDALSLPFQPHAMHARLLVAAADLARLQGDQATARQQLAVGEAAARRVGDAAALAQALTGLGLDLALQRELAQARERLDEAVSLHRELGDTWGLTIALGGRASVAHGEGDLALAHGLRMEAVEIARRAGDRESEAHALLGLGEFERQQGDYAGAGAHYERSLSLLRELGDPSHVGIALHNLAWVALAEGRMDEALQLLAEDLRLEATVANQIGPAFNLAAFAVILHARGHTETAVHALAAAHQQLAAVGIRPPPADAHEWERVRLTLHAALGADAFELAWSAGSSRRLPVILATVLGLLGIGPDGEVDTPQTAAGETSPRDGSTTQPSSAVAGAARLLERGSPAATPREPAAAALPGMPAARALPGTSAAAPLALTPGAPALRVLALGPLEIHRAGELLSGDLWRYARPKELLLYLLSHPKGRSREQVGLALWPDFSAAQVKNSFHVTLHHLRKVLGGNEWIVFENDRYRINAELGCEFDAALFEQRMRATLPAVRTGSAPPDHLREVLSLYRGDFLEEETIGDWHLEARDHLRRLWIEGSLTLGARLMGDDCFHEAAAVYERVVLREDMHEDAHRCLMFCLARAGNRVRALRHYDRLKLLLREELDIDPESETTALYERIRAAEPLTP
jgi:predicted ATPase/DNA-binding SARP family transcriptional activator/Tfp pilus assembly protein PilF